MQLLQDVDVSEYIKKLEVFIADCSKGIILNNSRLKSLEGNIEKNLDENFLKINGEINSKLNQIENSVNSKSDKLDSEFKRELDKSLKKVDEIKASIILLEKYQTEEFEKLKEKLRKDNKELSEKSDKISTLTESSYNKIQRSFDEKISTLKETLLLELSSVNLSLKDHIENNFRTIAKKFEKVDTEFKEISKQVEIKTSFLSKMITILLFITSITGIMGVFILIKLFSV